MSEIIETYNDIRRVVCKFNEDNTISCQLGHYIKEVDHNPINVADLKRFSIRGSVNSTVANSCIVYDTSEPMVCRKRTMVGKERFWLHCAPKYFEKRLEARSKRQLERQLRIEKERK